MHPADKEDAVVLKLLADPGRKEALSWLKGAGDNEFRNLGELEPSESIALVERLYALGARQVLACEIDVFPEGQNAGKLLIERPTEASASARLLDWANRHHESMGFMSDLDRGQIYLFVWLD